MPVCSHQSYHSNREDDANWPKKNIVGKQELEIRLGNDHIAFEVRHAFFLYRMVHWLYSSPTFVLQTAKIGALVDLQDSEDPEGLRVLYYLIQDLKVKRCSSFTCFSVMLGFPMTHFSCTVLYFLAHLAALQDQAHINVPVLFAPHFCSLFLCLQSFGSNTYIHIFVRYNQKSCTPFLCLAILSSSPRVFCPFTRKKSKTKWNETRWSMSYKKLRSAVVALRS